MKQFYRLALLTLVFGLFAACSSPPPPESGAVEEIEEVVDVSGVVAVDEEQSAPDPTVAPTEVVEATEEPVEETAEEAEVIVEEPEREPEEPVSEVDGPTHTPATSIEEALVEKAYDQAKGAEDPILTVIEYGDFQ